jgi:hypothetical protein
VLPARIPSKTTKKTKQPINKTIHFGMMKNCNQAASRTQKPEMPNFLNQTRFMKNGKQASKDPQNKYQFQNQTRYS